MIRGMENLFYERSLYKLNLLSLGKQRRRYDRCKIHQGRRQPIAAMTELLGKNEERNIHAGHVGWKLDICF